MLEKGSIDSSRCKLLGIFLHDRRLVKGHALIRSIGREQEVSAALHRQVGKVPGVVLPAQLLPTWPRHELLNALKCLLLKGILDRILITPLYSSCCCYSL